MSSPFWKTLGLILGATIGALMSMGCDGGPVEGAVIGAAVTGACLLVSVTLVNTLLGFGLGLIAFSPFSGVVELFGGMCTASIAYVVTSLRMPDPSETVADHRSTDPVPSAPAPDE